MVKNGRSKPPAAARYSDLHLTGLRKFATSSLAMGDNHDVRASAAMGNSNGYRLTFPAPVTQAGDVASTPSYAFAFYDNIDLFAIGVDRSTNEIFKFSNGFSHCLAFLHAA